MDIYHMNKRYRSLNVLLIVFLLTVFAAPVFATWSIVVVNEETGEVGIASATCVGGIGLKKVCGVIVVGKGAGQAQASIDGTGQNRTTIANGLLAGKTAQQIRADLEATDPNLHGHQYGIAALPGNSATFTGNNTMAYTSGLTGETGPIFYAIQGNVLTGEPVLLAAEQALIETEGDLGQKLMAAMHAAKYYGGDGRCSCKYSEPTICGSPPTKNQEWDKRWKSALVSYIVVARIGDVDGVFTFNKGFANGTYYTNINIWQNYPIDTVDVLQGKFEKFRESWIGHADHIKSEKIVYPASIMADGSSQSELLIALADINNDRLPNQLGRTVTVSHDAESAGTTTIGPVIHVGNGVYSVTLTSSLAAGTDIFRIVVEDGKGPVTLYPFPKLEVLPVPD